MGITLWLAYKGSTYGNVRRDQCQVLGDRKNYISESGDR